MPDYEVLRPYASTEKQIALLDALRVSDRFQDAAFKVRIDPSNARKMIRTLEANAAKQNAFLHETKELPPGYAVKGTSTLYDNEGNPTLQWVKTSVDWEKQQELFKEASEAFKDDLPKAAPIKSPKITNKDLLNLYVITDYHMGMLAWDEEAGDDWDLKIAERLLYNWFSKAIEITPNSETAILCNLGDFVHFDGLDAVTPAHHNVLDADTRFQKIVRVTIRVFRRIINDLLIKHKKVHVIMAEGNHDPASSVWLREWLSAHYENEKRVTVDLNPDPYYCYEFGKTSLFFHHGHKRKIANVDTVFTAKFAEIFGRTKFRYGHQGHFHNRNVKESNLMVIEQHRTLAAKDAYASRGGWMSGREAQAITYHKNFGEVSRTIINPEMVK